MDDSLEVSFMARGATISHAYVLAVKLKIFCRYHAKFLLPMLTPWISDIRLACLVGSESLVWDDLSGQILGPLSS